MADLRCPKCGKFNPSEMEKCLYCGAQLAPLPGSPTADSRLLDSGLPMPSSNGTAPSIMDEKANSPGEWAEMTFSMEAPDLLARPKPEPGMEKGAEKNIAPGDSENPEAEHPFQEKASSPEEIAPDHETSSRFENLIMEKKDPLAGLRGALPAGSQVGTQRRPPPYSTGLQVTEEQQRYAAYLERLMAGESKPAAAGTTRRSSNRWWRWLIAALLVLAVGLPFASGAQVAPAMSSSLDGGASATIIDGLSTNLPVLVAFDYEPALSGELEAVAAPVMDRLFIKGIPLALISTSPTGPALAERFVQDASLVNKQQNQGGVRYVNLGYLAGGPSGMSYFASSPTEAKPLSVDGDSAWTAGPLQGMRSLSSFAAIIILTDNADTGRSWIEQLGLHLGATPMLMIVSTQAAPMIQPYFDSAQIKGIVSGLPDARIYEQKYSLPGLALHYQNSYSVGMLVAEALIVAGAIWGVIARRREHRNDSRKGA